MSRFSVPIPVSRLHPVLTGEDAIFIRNKKDLGYDSLSAFLLLLESKGIEYPSSYSVALPKVSIPQ